MFFSVPYKIVRPVENVRPVSVTDSKKGASTLREFLKDRNVQAKIGEFNGDGLRTRSGRISDSQALCAGVTGRGGNQVNYMSGDLFRLTPWNHCQIMDSGGGHGSKKCKTADIVLVFYDPEAYSI